MFTFLDGMLNFQHIIDQLNNIEIIIICSCFSVEGNLVSSMPLYEKKEDRWLNVLKNKEAKFFRHHYGDWNVWVYYKYYNSFKCFKLVRKRECHHYCHKISLQYWRPQPVHDYDFFEYSFTHDCTSVWDMYSYNHLYRLLSMWPLECCMDEGKAVNWGLANQIFKYKTSTKVIGRKESLWKKKPTQASPAKNKHMFSWAI